MLPSQELQLRRSEISERLAELTEFRAKPDGLSDERAAEQVKLTAEFRETESAYRKAVTEEAEEETEQLRSSHEGEGEGREIRAPQVQASLQRYLVSARSRTALDGAERELNQALAIEDQRSGTFRSNCLRRHRQRRPQAASSCEPTPPQISERPPHRSRPGLGSSACSWTTRSWDSWARLSAWTAKAAEPPWAAQRRARQDRWQVKRAATAGGSSRLRSARRRPVR